ncbi:DUF4307 domain-containing protein [Gordonia aichiensis]|uniref:DUF4307 domain-containing protein n=1 Tax=Gordonia aichiensis NBRC 108223 TaxID=1220583 RepID=L7KMB7_9ACTN|nr:DUF4307 domain-containing protein [Gordonia aichiensis]GAC49097.1 hypothetical protein GOACH_10_00650 [Gordonia aichiensis NBRC 108223]
MNSSDGGTPQEPDLHKQPQSGPRATYPVAQSARSRRLWFIASAVAVVIIGVILAAIGYNKFADPDVSGQATGYEILDNSSVAVLYTVTRKDPTRPVACVVRARVKDGSEAGRREVLVPPGTQQEGLRTVVKTSGPPVIGEVFGCSTDVPTYLTSTAS